MSIEGSLEVTEHFSAASLLLAEQNIVDRLDLHHLSILTD